MKNILVITPFYCYPKNKNLLQDSNAVYYLCKNKRKDENIIVLYYYQHRKVNALKKFFPLLLKGRSYSKYQYLDDNGNQVFLFEHPCIIPKRYKTLSIFDLKYASILKKYLNEKNIEVDSVVVHFPSRFHGLTKRIQSKNKAFILHSFDVEKKERLKYVKSLSLNDDILGYRSYQIQRDYEKACGVAKKNFMCLSGIPDELLFEDFNRKQWKDGNILNLVYAGRLNGNKNVISVLKALNILKKEIYFKFTIIGDGEERYNLEKYVSDNGLEGSVIFTGALSRSNVFEYMRKSDVFIMVSKKETLGISYLEAMSVGNIVIGSVKRGIDGVITNDINGFLVEPLDVDEIAQTIKKIYDMPVSEAIKIRSRSLNTVGGLTESITSRNYIENIVGGK